MLQRITKGMTSVARYRSALFSSTKIPVNTGTLPQSFMTVLTTMNLSQLNATAEVVRKIIKSKAENLSFKDDYNFRAMMVCKEMENMPKDTVAYALGVNPAEIESIGFNKFNWFVINFKSLENVPSFKERLLDSDLECVLFKASESSNYTLKCYQENLEELHSFIVSGETLAPLESSPKKSL